jgi:GrpB-like predicted nucleotidyltransferase (UPF0157 family)
MITVEPYSSAWPSMFEAEAQRLRSIFGELISRIDHVGSTSVVGLAAKRAK